MASRDVTWARALTLFDQALEIDDQADRERMIGEACADDPSLGDAVRRLLDADAAESPLLDTPAAAHAAGLVSDSEPASEPGSVVGRTVGPYRIVRELGRGGMGVVYLAERDDVSLRVALKLVRGGLAAPEHMDRFLFERRVLARLEHPNIARLLDAGVEADGTPWFAMEYAEGEPIDEFCDARHLGVTERLALFERVCEAVQFAHRNLVVHRDLKPSNVLVVQSDQGATGAGEPKLLDFGIAKLLDDGSDAGLTATSTRLMTPEYAAPEQVRGQSVTTATDVYSLGVLLYELLTGRRPYVLRDASIAEVARAVLEVNPARPSSIVNRRRVEPTRSGDSQSAPETRSPEAIAAVRATTPLRLRRTLTGDLDTIIAKALEKDPSRRYDSAEALLSDLRRHREGRAVSARPATVRYRVGTFVRRHRVLVASTSATVVLLAGFGGAMTYEQARTARALRTAEAETEKARDVTGFLVGMFRDADPFRQPRAGDGAGRGALELATDRIDRELAGQPAIRSELLHSLGVIHGNLGNYARAEQLLRRAAEERLQVLGSDSRPDRELAAISHELGVTLRNRGAYDSSNVWFEQALAMRRAVLPPDHPDLATTLAELGLLRRHQGNYDEAGRLFARAVAIQEKRGDSPELAMTLQSWTVVLRARGDAKRAEQVVRRSIEMRERLFGPDHPVVASALVTFGWLLNGTDNDSAASVLRRALTIQQRWLGPAHPQTLSTLSQLSLVLRDQGHLAEAERMQRDVLARRRRIYGEYHRDVAGSLANLAEMARRRGDLRESEALLARSIDVYLKVSATDVEVWRSMLALGVMRHARGDDEGAARAARGAADFQGDYMWMLGTDAIGSLDVLASVLAKAGDCGRARTLNDRATAVYDKAPLPERPTRTIGRAMDACGIVR